MILGLPTEQGASAYSQRMVLDGASYTLDYAWNGREGAWYLSLYSDEGEPLLLSRKLSTNTPLLRHFRFVVGLPPGEFMAVDFSATIPYADYTGLGPGRGVQLLYYEASEGLP